MSKRKVIVSGGNVNQGAYASVRVCERPKCVEDAVQWVMAQNLQPVVTYQ